MANWGDSLRLLQTIVDAPCQHGVRGLARQVGLSKSAVQRLLDEWEKESLVTRMDDGKVGVGVATIRLAARVVNRLPVRSYALPLLKQLAENFKETVYLSLADDSYLKVVPVEVLETPHRMRYTVDVGQPLDTYLGAAGKPVLAYLSEAEISSIIRQTGLAPVTPRTITDERAFRADLAAIRRRGYAISYGERTMEVVAFGAAILDGQNKVIGCISLSIPQIRFVPGSEALCGEAVHEAALKVSQALGYPGTLRPDAESDQSVTA